MKLLRTYVLKEHLGPFLVTLSGLTAALLVGNIIKFAELVIAKGVSLVDVLRLLIYLLPSLTSFTIPMACLVSMVLAFGRLSSDYELIAMRASGVAPIRLVTPMLMVALLLSSGVLVLNDRIIPAAHLAFRKQLKTIGVKRPAAYLEAGRFIKEFVPYIIFVYQVEDRMLSDVRIYEPKTQGPMRTIIASRGEFEPTTDGRSVRLKLSEGSIDEWDPQRPGSLYKVSFGTYTMSLSADADARRQLGKKLKEMTFRELGAERGAMAAQGVDPLPIDLEIHRKIASSFATVVFVLVGLALGLGSHHHERLVIFVWVLGLFIAYYLLTVSMNAIAIKRWLPPALAMWVPNLIGLGAGGMSVWRVTRR